MSQHSFHTSHEHHYLKQPSPDAAPHALLLAAHAAAASTADAVNAPPTDRFLCTICMDTCDPTLRATPPACAHTFCLSCLLPWARVRELCPNCKAPFTSLLVHRDLTGALVPGPLTAAAVPPAVRESVALLHRVDWVRPREVLPPLHDLQDSFVFPPLAPALAARPAAPHYLQEEFEDELESRFWEEEEKLFDRLMGSRVLANRRFGANGYITSGHLRATPRPRPREGKKRATAGSSGAGVGSSAAHGARASGATESAAGRGAPPQGGPGSTSRGRKKKMKKKSRQGLAAAAQKKAEDEAAAARVAAESRALTGSAGVGAGGAGACNAAGTSSCESGAGEPASAGAAGVCGEIVSDAVADASRA